MIDRRKFLERSVLSAGSVLFSSVLLESCTKYGIPFPGGGHHPGGNTPPPLLGSTMDWNDNAKIVVKTGLEMIPEAGEILGGLVDIFWPKTPEDVWGQVKDQTEALVNQKIADAVYQQVTEDLRGLSKSTTHYLNYLKEGTTDEIRTQWMITTDDFSAALPHFQSSGNELALLGLFAQCANMYLALLRDGVAFGKSWGRTDADQQQTATDLKNAITDFTTYTTALHQKQRAFVHDHSPSDPTTCQTFGNVNQYDRQMTFTVLDFRDTWPYYDVTQYPIGTEVVLTREIYSDPMGGCTKDFPGIYIPSPVPTQRPTHISVWDYDLVSAVQVTYPAGSGPGGVTRTLRMGSQNYGNYTSVDLPIDNPIIAVQCTMEYTNLMAFQLFYYNGSRTSAFGNPQGNNGGRPMTSTWAFPNEVLSSIYVNGVNHGCGGNCIASMVFGFQYWLSPSATLKALRTLYVTSPKERSAADFAKAFPKLAIPAGLITYELKAARLAHWAYIAARVEEIG